MDWKTIDWGAIVFAAFIVGGIMLFVLAARRMRAKKRQEASEDDDSRDTRKKKARRRATRERRKKARKEPDETSDSAPDVAAESTEEPPKQRGKKGRKGPKGKKGKKGKTKSKPAVEQAEEEPIETAPVQPDDAEATEEERQRLTKGLAKTRGGFISKLGKLFAGKQIDEALLDEIEEVLFTADIGVKTSQELIDGLRKKLSRKELANSEAIWKHLRKRTTEMLADQGRVGIDPRACGVKPFVLLMVGVNGTGKTTTIGKLASRLTAEGFSILLAAADTFRAAAVQQLEVWADRAGAPIVKGKEGADPSSVVVEALKRAKTEGTDIVIADTAGRLHTKVSLMDELQKLHRAIGKHVEGAPHEAFLVLDATTGQNAITQATMFKEAMDLSGLVLTKLDGTAKGGVVLGICNELGLPVRFIGIGEKVDDLREFDPSAFVEALYEGQDIA